MKNKYRILKILSTVLIFGFLLSFSLKRFNRAPLDKISIKMNNDAATVYFIDEKDVKDLVKKENPTLKIGNINIPELEKKLNRLPAVDSANVYLNLNGSLNLDIKQRVPVFRIVNGDDDFYVDAKGVEFPLSKNYSHPCMLVTGNVKKDEYVHLADLITKINKDDFSKKFFVGISKYKGDFSLLTSDGNYRVEIGDLDNIDFKVKGFKAFAEKFLIDQSPEKYSKISLKFDNQIVTTLNPNFEENDSLLAANNKALAKLPAAALKTATAVKKPVVKIVTRPKEKPKVKPKEKVQASAVIKKLKAAQTAKKEAPKKSKAKIKVE